MRIITVSREFGSGGRELGKRIADNMGIQYIDREIITEVARNANVNESLVEAVLDKGLFRDIHLTYGHTFASFSPVNHTTHTILEEQKRLITKMAQERDCVIVGRNADVILEDMNPLKLFVYADMSSKIARCQGRAPEGEHLSDREMEKMIKRINRSRARTHAYLSHIPWGNRAGYHLCVNTTDTDIKAMAKLLADYAEHWFAGAES